MTFSTLRALHAIIGEALDDIQRVYTQSEPTPSAKTTYASPSAPPAAPASPKKPLDFPCLNAPYDPEDPAEQLRSEPLVSIAIGKILAAAGQLSAIVQSPMMTLTDVSTSYHLSTCLRLLEASNAAEIIREAGPGGLHTGMISKRTGVDNSKLAHTLRLLATHHILCEREPDVFALNRISSLLDTGKSVDDLEKWRQEGIPEAKYWGTNGIAALMAITTDELQKSATWMTEAYLLSPDPPLPPFQHAFGTKAPFFAWLEGQGAKEDQNAFPTPRYRVERFGSAMQGTRSWEVPGAILHGFDWRALPRDSVIVDVGGGIGNTTMLLADAFARDGGLKFVVQDRPAVVEAGVQAWRAKYPELLDSGAVRLEAHDFLTPQPIKNATVFLVRVVLHNWPDAQARTILECLRRAATEDTKLLLADFILPLACPDPISTGEKGAGAEDVLAGVEGAEMALASPPLLANLGKGSAHVYSLDMTMHALFNAKERTLREIVTLAREAGWKVVKVSREEGSLFGHLTAVPIEIPSGRSLENP